MPGKALVIIQTNEFKCEVCGKVERTREETTMYADPVVRPPRDGWGYDERDRLVCPECPKT